MGDVITKIRDLDGNYFFLKEELEGLASFVREKIEIEPTWFDEFFALADQKALDVLASEGGRDVLSVLHKAVACLSCSKVVELLDYGLQAYVTLSLKQDPARLFSAMKSYRVTHLMQYEKELRDLRVDDIKNFVERHKWVGTHGFKGQPLSEEVVRAHLQEGRAVPTNVVTSSSPGLVVELASKLGFYRSYLVETVDRVTFSYWSVLGEVAQNLGVAVEELLLLTFEELEVLLHEGRWPTLYRLRRDKMGLVNETGVIEVVTGERLEYLLRESFGEQKEVELVREVRGSAAYPGIVRGVARVMKHPRDVANVEKGDILIASETTPDYILGMKRAGAFVTDQGGITSHAAIVARELGKPCVVGTKLATKIFEDGMWLEVNGDRGVVMRLD